MNCGASTNEVALWRLAPLSILTALFELTVRQGPSLSFCRAVSAGEYGNGCLHRVILFARLAVSLRSALASPGTSRVAIRNRRLGARRRA